MFKRLSFLGLTGLLFASSCMSDLQEPNQIEASKSQNEVAFAEANVSDVNARKAVERNYFERFTNQISLIPVEGFIPDYGAPAYYPGAGLGNSSHMGKAYSFLNQFATVGAEGLETKGRPVTQFYGEELAALGLTNIPDEVSSITTDGKGNSVWFKNINNQVSPVGPDRMEFVAEVEIINGTGKFEGATGTATVKGHFNPLNGKGMSTISGRIIY